MEPGTRARPGTFILGTLRRSPLAVVTDEERGLWPLCRGLFLEVTFLAFDL
jgi:hypothetical protein